MTAMSKGTKFAIIIGAIGIAAGVGITLAVVDKQTEGLVFEVVEDSDDNPFLNPSFLKTYNDVRTGAHYKTRLAVGEEGFFISSAKGGKEPYTFEWKFSDGVTLNAANVTRSFDSADRYYFDLTITDAEGKQAKSLNTYIDVLDKLPTDEAVNSTSTKGTG
jgi:PKD repeat protein